MNVRIQDRLPAVWRSGQLRIREAILGGFLPASWLRSSVDIGHLVQGTILAEGGH